MSLTCKFNFTGTERRIFRGKVIAGLLKTSSWKNDGYGELDGNMLRFKTRGFWQRKTEIRDIEGRETLGEIEYHLLKGAATIKYSGRSYHWHFASWTRQKWEVKNDEESAKYQATSLWKNEGELVNEGVSAAVILASLFVSNHFRKITAAS